jgi:Uncharacterized protein conserved in bacteria (DUF2188)
MSDVHVATSGDGWALEGDGQEHGTFSSQREAVRQGRQLAEQEHGELVIHGEGGAIREKDSHGNDPRSIPG